MPRECSDDAALFDMLQAAQGVLRHTAGKIREDYEREELLRDAVERKIEIIGEAARRLTKAFRDQHPQVPWRVIMATRHILTDHIPPLIEQLKPLIPPQPQE